MSRTEIQIYAQTSLSLPWCLSTAALPLSLRTMQYGAIEKVLIDRE